MNVNKFKKIIFLLLGMAESIGIVLSFIAYSSVFEFMPWHKFTNIFLVVISLLIFTVVALGMFILSKYMEIKDKTLIFILANIAFSLMTLVLLQLASYAYAMLIAVSIIGVAASMILFFEVVLDIIEVNRETL